MSTKAAKSAKVLKLNSLKANLASEQQGEWVTYRKFEEPVEFKCSSFYTPAYVSARDLEIQRLMRKYKGEPVPQAERDEAFGRLYAKHILHDWRDIDAPYTPELALELLTDPAYRTIFDAVEWCASQVGQAKAEFMELAVKNSARPSDGA